MLTPSSIILINCCRETDQSVRLGDTLVKALSPSEHVRFGLEVGSIGPNFDICAVEEEMA
ncbi:hypothetical protein Rleg4DRAFT_1870 [Rhizobium leguminosarum bv. trifolii WSM2297]|uniref:Uncharacterized protein n=1 Tax=Rhizobium leguminosarum bv. trifolii WSM2297 TaxID=754762 RepID=J0KRW4_RHILT|nr:hypothetical protein [Rhizobium leguminosarum]EJC80249.1 hypothetical protein Rleg4DRAFT_1870 [Rhizobium leguminosarum bv. trifolii WSM2297]